MTQTNILEVINNKEKRSSAIFVIDKDGEYFLYKGDKIKVAHF